MAKEKAGVPFRTIVGPGTVDAKTGLPGISERGYPMISGPSGLHGKLLDQLQAGGSINRWTNTKPSYFGPNLVGNRSGATIDTHAIRGTLMTYNEMHPGQVPEGFILPKFREAYQADPTALRPDMIDDSIGKQKITTPSGERVNAQTEYPVFADIWHEAARRLDAEVAETQSMGWFGFGDETNLGSDLLTPVDVVEQRLSVTAQALGIPIREAARLYFSRQIPLMGLGGAGLLGMALDEEEPQL